MNTPEQLPRTVDIAIVGGGMVGLSLAAVLAGCNPSIDIALIEAISLSDMAADTAFHTDFPPSFDARSTALSESSRHIYEQIGLWDQLANYACPISSIHVSDRGKPGATRMSAGDSGLAGLGYVIENRVLGKILLAAVAKRANVLLHSPAQVDCLRPLDDGMEIHIGDRQCNASLVVAADGANSALLQSLGIHTEVTDYGRTALIANIALAEPHQGVAYERFTDEGPIALLPLPDVKTEYRAALVWTLRQDHAERLIEAGEKQFLEELHKRFGFRAGRFLRSGSRSSYPLKLMVAQEQIRRHLVVAGNAAHFLHPVAGQGFNLALRDVARLAQVILPAILAGRNPGDLALLESYLEGQQVDQRNTIGFSHTLPALFGNPSAASAVLRNSGLIALDLIQPARQEFANFGAGLATAGVKLNGRG